MTEKCLIDDCLKYATKGRGLCNRHYLKARKSGTLSTPTKTERTFSFVEHCVKSETDSCLTPTFKSRSDYPSFVMNGKHYKLGWLVLEMVIGPRPSPESVMRHVICGNSRCCNPRHLIWGTEKENMEDMKRHGTEADRRGSKNGMSKLTEQQVLEIRKEYVPYVNCRKPSNQRELAIRYSVNVGVIRALIKGKTWKHV